MVSADASLRVTTCPAFACLCRHGRQAGMTVKGYVGLITSSSILLRDIQKHTDPAAVVLAQRVVENNVLAAVFVHVNQIYISNLL